MACDHRLTARATLHCGNSVLEHAKFMDTAYVETHEHASRSDLLKFPYRLPALAIVICLPLAGEETVIQDVEDDDNIEEIVVTADLDSIPTDDIQSIFGFDKSILETPRSASSVSEEMLDRFIIADIDELVALTPGSFTQSFFGVAGSLDIRGTPGETYFRGIRRLDNPGNYPTPLAASSRVDIVRGPASPIHGPAKIGGYLDFYPKSAHVEDIRRRDANTYGSFGLELGSWQRRLGMLEIGGPGIFRNKEFGYTLFAELEDSGSYYANTTRTQGIVQASFNVDFDVVELQFGGMYHQHQGNEVAGWNRITQELIDDGTYVTGSPQALDVNGDGFVSHQEFDVDGDGFSDLNPFAAGLTPGSNAPLETEGLSAGTCRIGETLVFGCRPELLTLRNVGTTKIDGSQVVVDKADVQDSEVSTLYFDVIYLGEGGWEWRNQMFFETYDVVTEVAYGFSQFHDTWVFENKLVVANQFDWANSSLGVQLSPSMRYTNFEHGDDYSNEYFDRRDLTKPASALDRRLLSTRQDADYTDYFTGDYLDLGLAVLTDLDVHSFNLLFGARYDVIDISSRQPLDKLLLPSSSHFCPDGSCVVLEADDQVNGLSWTASLSYSLGSNLRPYITASQQATIIAGQGAEISTASIADGKAFDDSELLEYGLKGSFLNDLLYFAIAVFEQERTDYSAQQIVTNQATRTEGTEFEMRWLVTEPLLVSAAFTRIEVVNLNTLNAGGRFSFIGADDVPGIPRGEIYGGALVGQIIPSALNARRAGMPENIVSLTGTYNFGQGIAMSMSVVDVASTHSGFSRSVTLPAYTLVNAGLVIERESWVMSASAKNLTDERYFRANFPNIFGGVIVLPELPRNLAVRVQYKW